MVSNLGKLLTFLGVWVKEVKSNDIIIIFFVAIERKKIWKLVGG